MNVLLFGGKGHCGKHIYEQLTNNNKHRITTITRDEVERILINESKIYLNERSIVINCAGVVGKKNAEKDAIETNRVNIELPKRLAQMCEQRGAKMIHISTQSVFDSSTASIRLTKTPTKSDSIYGISKIAGEQEIQKHGNKFQWCILRTPYHYSNNIHNPRNLLTGLINAALKDKKIVVSRNELFSACSCNDIARRVDNIIEEDLKEKIEHLAEDEKWKWEEIAMEIKKHLNKQIEITYPESYFKSDPINSTLEGNEKQCTQNLCATIKKIINRL